MAGNNFTLENIGPLILELSQKDKEKAKKLKDSLYKLPRYRSRKTPTSQPNFTPQTRKFWSDYWKGKVLKRHANDYGQFRYFGDTRERCWDYVRNKGFATSKYDVPSDTGSEFMKVQIGWENHRYVYEDVWHKEGIYNMHYYGYISANPDSFLDDGINVNNDVSMPPSMDYDIDSWSPTAWNRYKPAQPTLGLGQFIAETRELPRLFKAELEHFRDLGRFYLSSEFGWKPFLRDVLEMLNFVDKFRKQVEFFYLNAGKPIRRRGTVMTSQTSSIIYDHRGGTLASADLSSPMNYRAYDGVSVNECHGTCTKVINQSIEFNGQFVFWFDGKPPEYTTLVAKLAGLEITPQLLWELLPWSWLIDYFSNIGDVIDNMNTEVADRQLSRYAYIFGLTDRRYKFHGTDGKNTASIERFFRTKVRRVCHPFGLATSSTLSIRQAAILAALGISRTPRKIPV